MNKKEFLQILLKELESDYPTVVTPLEHKNIFELFVSAMLSPQTTDLVTNKVCIKLLQEYPDFISLSNASEEKVLKIISAVNYNKVKTGRIIKASKKIVDEFGGVVPSKFEELLKFEGIGRKIANLIINEWFVKNEFIEPEGFVVDTHVCRVSRRLFLTDNKEPVKIEADLMKLFEKNLWPDLSLRMIFHGRDKSQAKNPKYFLDSRWKNIYEMAEKTKIYERI